MFWSTSTVQNGKTYLPEGSIYVSVYFLQNISDTVWSSLDILNVDISNYTHISSYILVTFPFFISFQFLLSQTIGISMSIFWDQKIYYEISVVCVNFDLSRNDCLYFCRKKTYPTSLQKTKTVMLRQFCCGATGALDKRANMDNLGITSHILHKNVFFDPSLEPSH